MTCFDGRRENWALGVWSSPVMIVWMIWIALMVGGETGPWSLELTSHDCMDDMENKGDYVI